MTQDSKVDPVDLWHRHQDEMAKRREELCVLPPEAKKEWPAPMPIDLATALAEVVNEVKRAQELYSRPFVNAHEAHSIIREEFQEVENIVYVNHKNRNSAKFRNELVQLAAMCIRTLIEVDPHTP